MKQRSEYLDLRRRFEPVSATVVVVAESPPVSGQVFLRSGRQGERAIVRAMMKQLGVRPGTKLEGLAEFQKRGWTLVDATYEPVNGLTGRGRDLVIDRDYPELRNDLRQLMTARWSIVPLVLLKANVCGLLEPKLRSDGFNVLNNGRVVYFPSHGRQRDFDRMFREIAPQ